MGIVRTIAIALVASGFCAACDKAPTGPTPDPPPAPPAQAVTRSVEVVGPQTVPLGGTAQFSVMAHLTDGSSRDVTNEASWHAGSGHLISISTPGLAAGRERGEVRVTADFDGRRGWTDVMVLPAGTYRLMGTVLEAHASPGPVVGALVEVTTGVGARLTAHTDHSGTYRLYGVSGQTGLRVTKDGYQPTAGTAFVTDQSAMHNVALPLVAPRVDVSGIYTLTITAASHCGAGLGDGRLPDEARVRTYQADVRQDGPRVEVRLSGAALRGRPFFGRVEPGRVVFDLGWYTESGTDERPILEQLATSTFFVVGGGVTAAVSANRLAGALSGEIHIFDTDRFLAPPIAVCSSETHQFVLSR